jgi:hypothetical protein
VTVASDPFLNAFYRSRSTCRTASAALLHPIRFSHGRRVPNSIGTRDEEKGSLDFTQRIERKLAEYNASQSIFKRWLFEVLSWSVSATSMAAVVGIYVHLKVQPISSSRPAVLLTMANVLGKVASWSMFRRPAHGFAIQFNRMSVARHEILHAR